MLEPVSKNMKKTNKKVCLNTNLRFPEKKSDKVQQCAVSNFLDLEAIEVEDISDDELDSEEEDGKRCLGCTGIPEEE